MVRIIPGIKGRLLHFSRRRSVGKLKRSAVPRKCRKSGIRCISFLLRFFFFIPFFFLFFLMNAFFTRRKKLRVFLCRIDRRFEYNYVDILHKILEISFQWKARFYELLTCWIPHCFPRAQPEIGLKSGRRFD